MSTLTQQNVALARTISAEMPDLDCEICGSWLWISGDTKPHKERLKELGCRWSKRKQKWYKRGAGGFNKRPWTMEAIRAEHGSAHISQLEEIAQ